MPEQDTDWILVDRVRAGDDRGFDALMARYKRPVLAFVFRLIGDRDEAQDVAQEVFVRAYRSLRKPGFHATAGPFSTWLFQIARNAAIDCLRHRRRHPAEPLSTIEEEGSLLPASAPTAAEETVAREAGRQVAAAIALLPEEQRTAIVLSEYEDLSHAEIAAVLGCTPKSVEARLYRARQFLRQRLARLLS